MGNDAYTSFMSNISKGRGKRAYEIFRENPLIIGKIAPDEIPDCYQKIFLGVGKRQADCFYRAAAHNFYETMDKIKLFPEVQEIAKAICLERLFGDFAYQRVPDRLRKEIKRKVRKVKRAQ